jgi:hypothetical protein
MINRDANETTFTFDLAQLMDAAKFYRDSGNDVALTTRWYLKTYYGSDNHYLPGLTRLMSDLQRIASGSPPSEFLIGDDQKDAVQSLNNLLKP